jgi:enamine deaminase RidA (YjgF/YER057c/UK114 family)
MNIIRHDTGKLMSAAVEHAGTVYVGGQVADDRTKGVTGQTEQVLTKIDSILTKAKTDKSKLLSANVWLADMKTFDEMNKVWRAWVIPGNTPARATVEARLALPDILVEIAVICAK